MTTWKATIKERGNDHLLTPELVGNMFDYITDEQQRDNQCIKYLIGFWGLEEPDVEWYKLEKIDTP